MAWNADTLAGVLRALIAAALIAPAGAHGAEWHAQLEITAVVDGEARRTTPLTVGMSEGATDAFDRGSDLLAPPAPPGWRYAEAYIHRPTDSAFYRRLNRDIRATSRPDGSPARWEIVVDNPTDADWTLSWDASSLPEEWRHVCLDGGSLERVLDMRAETMATIPPSGLFVFGVTVARDPLPAAEEALLPDALAASPAPSEAAGTDDADEPEPDATPVDAPMADTLPHVTVAGIDEPDTAGPADADDLVVEAAFLDSRLDADVTPPAEAVVERLREDVDGDGIVGLADLVHVARRFGAHVTVGDLADVDGDGVVTIRDLLYVATAMQAVGAAPSRGALAGDAAKLLAGDISPEGFVRAVASSTRDADTQLLPNYPNPFNPETWIPFDLEGDGVVTLTVYDTRGSVVRRLDLGYLAGGGYRTPGRAAHWDGRTESGETAGSGTYIVALNAGGETHRRRVMLVK